MFIARRSSDFVRAPLGATQQFAPSELEFKKVEACHKRIVPHGTGLLHENARIFL
jgi:hypothetical protein